MTRIPAGHRLRSSSPPVITRGAETMNALFNQQKHAESAGVDVSSAALGLARREHTGVPLPRPMSRRGPSSPAAAQGHELPLEYLRLADDKRLEMTGAVLVLPACAAVAR
jgi:hypothetical protein